MSVEDFLVRHKPAVLKKWQHLIVSSYPTEVAEFLKRERDRFQNPVGYLINRLTEQTYEVLASSLSLDSLFDVINDFVKVRAVQDLSPSQAVRFVFLLKQAIREEAKEALAHPGFAAELLAVESKIDDVALLVFESYMMCREKIYSLKIREVKNGAFKLHRDMTALSPVEGPEKRSIPEA